MERGNGDGGVRKEENFRLFLPALMRQLASVIRSGGWTSSLDLPDEDIQGEVTLEAWRSFSMYKGNTAAEFAAWAKRVAFGTLRRLHRSGWMKKEKETHQVLSFDAVDDEERDVAFLAICDSALMSIEREERLGALQAAIESLPQDDAILIRLCYWEDLSVVQLAESMQTSRFTIQRRIKSALEKLTRFLKHHPKYKEIFVP